jgi:uncharacterized protein
MIIDLFEFARHERSVSGAIAIAVLTRIEASTRDGVLDWSARGSLRGRHGGARLDLAVDGTIPLVCQRCMQPMQEPVHVATKFLIAADDDTAEALDQDDEFDVIVGSAAFDLDALIEDEVLLALPSAPRHRVCPDGQHDLASANRRPSPFAALAAFKAPDGEQGSDG